MGDPNYVFGPVPSRRLGQSLGIDTLPLKTCNWNCVYCQLGRTRPLVHQRKAWCEPGKVLGELGRVVSRLQPGEVDWISFVGSGEPLLDTCTGQLIREAKGLTGLPVAVITNGSLLYLPEVREDLSAADAVLPSLDAGTEDLYRRINRPHPQASFERLLNGLEAFRQVYEGQLWPEFMLVGGLNDTEESLERLAVALRRIEPDAVHISIPTRPPAETWVRPPDEAGLMRATVILGDVAELAHPIEGTLNLKAYDDEMEALISIITRHPMRREDLENALAPWPAGQVCTALKKLESCGRARAVVRYGTRFWTSTDTYFPEESQDRG